MNKYDSMEEYGIESMKRLVKITKKLTNQGTRLYHATTGSHMILFVGRQADKIVDIQTQFGSDIKQLFISTFGSNEAFQIRINHQHDIYQQDIETFSRGIINPGIRMSLENDYPRLINRVNFNLPVMAGDLEQLVGILEMATIDKSLLEQTVAHDTASGQYRRDNKRKLSFGNIFRLIRK